MESRLNNFDIKNLITRVFSAILFIPLIIMPIILKGYSLYLVYLFLLSLMVIELIDMIKISKKKAFIYLYLMICVLTIFTFILSISTIDNISFKIIEMILTIWIFDTFCYLGGKTFNGIDCSALVQLFMNFNRSYCPRDAKDQVKYFKKNIKLKNIKKDDIIFWKGHVAVALSNKKLIHAYGPMKKTVVMGINQTIERIKQTANLKVIGIKRI